jgi:hypothetical protein
MFGELKVLSRSSMITKDSQVLGSRVTLIFHFEGQHSLTTLCKRINSSSQGSPKVMQNGIIAETRKFT